MNISLVIKFGQLGLILFLVGCSANNAAYIKNVEKLNNSEYSQIQVGKIQNFTSIKTRVFDRSMQHEVSYLDDPNIQRQINNLGGILYVSSVTPPITTTSIQAPVPNGTHSSWDKYYIVDWQESKALISYLADFENIDPSEIRNYVALGKTTKKGGDISLDKQDYGATIVDEGEIIYYSDASTTLKFIRKPIAKKGIHSDWDKYYVSENNQADIFKSSKQGIYRFGYVDANGTLNYFDFIPKFRLYQSTKYGIYRAAAYRDKARKWIAMDYIPTKKLICFDLARAYNKVTNNRDSALTHAALSGILIAIGGHSKTRVSGTTQSNYNGYYAGRNWTGTGTHVHTGYAKTYDYSYLARGALLLLDTAFSTNASVENIRSAIKQNQCGFDV